MGEWKNILIAVDEMESSLKAVEYVGRLVSHLSPISICLLHVYDEPTPDFFQQGGDLDEYQAGRIARAEKIFRRAIEILVEAGVGRQDIYTTTHMAECQTISETILEVQRKGDFGTVVAGKRGVSKAEEFLFGSISNALARHCLDFTTWIVG